jgi:hypothetical protein
MLTAILFAAALTAGSVDGGQVSVIATTPAPAEAARPGDETTSRRVCRFERATGSNFQQRVCRDIPRQSVQDQQTREFMRATQRMRLPDEGAMATPGGPNG